MPFCINFIISIAQQNAFTGLFVQFIQICDGLRDLVSFVHFKKREKHPWRNVTFTKVADFHPATLLKVTFVHGCFSRFLNCTNDTKSRKTFISNSLNTIYKTDP